MLIDKDPAGAPYVSSRQTLIYSKGQVGQLNRGRSDRNGKLPVLSPVHDALLFVSRFTPFLPR